MFSAHSDAYHPSPSWDRELGYIFDHEHCGFNSREALYEWFADYTRVLSECGFRVFVYDVADEYVRVGSLGGQAIFDRCAAIEKSREDLDLAPAQLELFA
jgi:hypothetical protein